MGAKVRQGPSHVRPADHPKSPTANTKDWPPTCTGTSTGARGFDASAISGATTTVSITLKWWDCRIMTKGANAAEAFEGFG